MSALENQPDNLNYLSPLGFRFTMDRIPKCTYFLQGAEIPNISLGEYDESTPLAALPYPGDKLRFDPLTITFRVDEDLQNYLEINNWLQGLGFPESFQQYTNLINDRTRPTTQGQDANIYSDGGLILYTSSQNPNVLVKFKNLFPISLSAITLASTESDVNYVEATAQFRYYVYNIELINK